MRKSILILAMFALAAPAALAQTSYQVDNFDLPNAVQVQAPKVEPKPASQTKQLTKLRNTPYAPAPGALIHLTSQPLNPSLGSFTTGNTDVDTFIVESGKRNSVDPLLLYSIMHQES